MNCKVCNKKVDLRIGWRAVTLRCTACGRDFSVKDYIDELDDAMWETIARRPCNRV